MKGDLEARDLSNPKQVWDDGEMTPMPSPAATLTARTGMLGRVADAGDLGRGNPLPYDLAVQAEVLSQSAKGDSSLERHDDEKKTGADTATIKCCPSC